LCVPDLLITCTSVVRELEHMAEKAKAVLDKVKESRGADPSKGAASNGIVENSLDTKKLDDII